MDGREIAWRIRSLLRDQVDLVRIPLNLLPKPDDHPAQSRFEAGFSCSPVTPEQWQTPLSEEMAAWKRRLCEYADQILDNRLTYFDLVNEDHGRTINWHRDHSAGIDTPVRLSLLTDYRDFKTFGDCKLVWEPNRHHQFVVLARAFVATGDRKYADKVAEQMAAWIAENRFGYGMNWKSPLELGIRTINWIWALDLLRTRYTFDARLWNDVLQCLFLASWDSQRKFSRGSSANNHLVGEAAGVFYAACYFPAFPGAGDWIEKSQQILEREIRHQTFEDGCTREHAFGYQFFVIQFFSLCMSAGDAAGHPFSLGFRDRLHAMFRFLNDMCAATGSPPNMGDRDDGYVLDLGELPHQPRQLLDIGASLFDDETLCSPTPSETSFWLFGTTNRPGTSPMNQNKSKSYPKSGYHVLRSDRLGVFFDCAELGYGPIAAHGHADCLSFCLSVDGEPVFIDAGTYDYFTYPEWRNYFRETRAHNTVEIDGQSQSQMLGPFIWGARACSKLLKWRDSPTTTIVRGQHDGYRHLPDPVIHQRSIELAKGKNTVRIVDSISANASHKLRMHFHLDPHVTAKHVSESEVELALGTGRLTLRTSGPPIEIIRAGDNSRLGWISRGYHRKEASTCLRIEQDITGAADIHTTISLA